jgi:Ca-activated chloride channel family protein
MPTFAHPVYLLIGLCACIAAVLFIALNIQRRKKELRHFAAPNLLTGLTRNVSPSKRRLKNIVLVSGLACLFIALARPQYGDRWIEVRRKGIDILIGIDVSKSMLAQDIKPNRLGRAKLAVRDFVAKLEGDRVGLLPFAGTAFLMCPLTTDYDAFNASLDTLDTGTIPRGGTDLGVAIRRGAEALSNEANHKIFVLVTDGEDLSEVALKAAEEAKEQKMTVYTIGVGTPEGELVPMPGGQAGRFVKDEQGDFVTSKLDEETLTAVAETTGGLYAPLGSMGQGFDTIYEQKLALIPKEEHGRRKRKIPVERFPWPLAAAVLLLSADFLLTGRRNKWALRLPFVKTAGRREKQAATAAASVLLLAVCAACFAPAPVQASEGEELFKAGDYQQAEEFYQQALHKDSANPALHFNLGGSLYRQKKYEQAAVAFTQALATDDLALQAQSYYNRGNSQYFLGAATEADDAEQALKQWNESKKSFEAALKLAPEDKAAAYNMEMVSKKLEQLKEKMRQSGKQCDNPKSGDGDQEKKGDEKKNDQQQGDKEQGGEDEQDKKEGQEQQQEKQKDGQQEKKSGKEQEEKTGAAQEQTDQQADQQEEEQPRQKAVPEPDKQDKEEETPAAEDIQKAAAAQEEQQDQDKKNMLSAEDMERRVMGKMTEEEARNLLNSLKGEQGELNFIPGSADDKPVGKDW